MRQGLLDKPQALFALVLSPTRELAIQIAEQFEYLGAGIGVRTARLVGGIDMMGQAIALGKRPHVRGVAMNPVDHPHGGGEGRTSGGRNPVTPWGVPTKGKKTRSNKRTDVFILSSRHNRKK